ncbi:diguanylate cyclase [Thalassotalea ganghwensis]
MFNPLLKVLFSLLGVCLFLLSFQAFSNTLPVTLNINDVDDTVISKHFLYFQESGDISPDQALAIFRGKVDSQHKPLRVDSSILSLGLNSPPVWMYIRFYSEYEEVFYQHVVIDNSWLDNIDLYFYHGNVLNRQISAGDAYAFDQRAIKLRTFDIPYGFLQGETELLIKITTTDPLVVPIYLLNAQELVKKEEFDMYSYGMLYGAILVMLLHNFIIYFTLRDSRYLFYCIFLTMFLFANVAYTGHGYRWLWSDFPRWQYWSTSSSMVLYAISGLMFAQSFLNLKHFKPKLDRVIGAFCVFSALVYLLIAAIFGGAGALTLAFALILFYPFIMLSIGGMAIYHGYNKAFYFFFGTVFATVGSLITGLVTLGVIPFSTMLFRAVEIGKVIDMVVLASALAIILKKTQDDAVNAKRTAFSDHLTGLHNRRGWYAKVEPFWEKCLLEKQDFSLIALDIDHFKQINDTYGHGAGDKVLIAIANEIQNNRRKEDVIARWGGEEMIIALPNASIDEAIQIGHRILNSIRNVEVEDGEHFISVTVSLGLVCKEEDKNVDEMIKRADHNLYQAKRNGRDQLFV